MQYTQCFMMLFLLFGVPSMSLAQTLSPTPLWVFSSGIVVLLSLSIYVGLKIWQNLKNDLDKPAP
jgi:hypothetical protein